MKILHIDSSVRNGRSISRELSALFIEQVKQTITSASIDYLDLAKDCPNHPSELFIRANYCLPEERTKEMWLELAESESLVDRLTDADIYVIGMPMYNFSVPSIFKSFIDNIVRIDRTFRLTGTGSEGLLLDKKAFVINTRGVDFNNDNMEHMDQLRPYLKAIFGFMGITDLTFINVSPVQFSNAEARSNAIQRGKEEIIRTAHLLNN